MIAVKVGSKTYDGCRVVRRDAARGPMWRLEDSRGNWLANLSMTDAEWERSIESTDVLDVPEPTEPEPTPVPSPAPLLDASFENGLVGWNTAGVGDVVPTVVTDVVRRGSRSARVVLQGSQSRSELILGGRGDSNADATVKLREGDERFLALSVYVKEMMYGRPGAHNLLMQLKSNDEGSPNFGLQMWDYEGKRGLWSHGDAMGGDRFLAAFPHGVWHDIVVAFKASRQGTGAYTVYLAGKPVSWMTGTNIIRPDREYAYVKAGLYRNGSAIPGTSDLRLDGVRLGSSMEAVA